MKSLMSFRIESKQSTRRRLCGKVGSRVTLSAVVVASAFSGIAVTAVGAATPLKISDVSYAATDVKTRMPHQFFEVPQAEAELDPLDALGPEVHFKIALPQTLIGDQTPPTDLSAMINQDGSIPKNFSIFGPTATGSCVNLNHEVSCKIQYVLSYLKTVDFDQAAELSQLRFASQPAVLKDALASIKSFRFDPEGVLKFHLGPVPRLQF